MTFAQKEVKKFMYLELVDKSMVCRIVLIGSTSPDRSFFVHGQLLIGPNQNQQVCGRHTWTSSWVFLLSCETMRLPFHRSDKREIINRDPKL